MMNVEVQKRQPMGLMRHLSHQDSFSTPGLRDDRGWTPLHIAVRMGDLTEVQRLIDEGADVNEPSSGPKAPGTTPLHLAATGGHVAVMDELLEHGANMEARTKGGCG
jgi:ankyrin repeat protein